ncbi:MAG: phosphotransferase, partial [Thermoanaerobaculia bacterium]
HIHHHVFSPVGWEEIFTYYARNDVKPRIEPGLSFNDLEALQRNPEEQYIIKRLFANSDVVQIFRMDEGFSGSRIYTVKPRHQLKRILKIGSADDLEAVQEKQERLIQPRLFRQVGQIRGKVISAQHLGGACYSLAGSNRDAITLSQFLLDQNRVRKELLDHILEQLRDSLTELYTGNSEIELRYWAPLYSQVLPPTLTLEDAILVGDEAGDEATVLDANSLTALSAVPGNSTLEGINQAVRDGEKPEVTLHRFEVAELDSSESVLYLHDTLTERYPADPALSGKEHPILRFKVYLRPSEHGLLTHPVLRRGKQVSVRGKVRDTQETILARNVGMVTGQAYDFDGETFEFAKARFIPLLENIRYLLWEVGREDMIVPMPIVSPVVHGDLNAGNILVEASPEMPIWLIDFSDARPGHIYFDLAKLEVEVRTHVFFRLFKEMVEEHLWDATTAQQFGLLVENLLLQMPEASFEDFAASLREYQSEWYDALYTQFPLYFENLLYFIFSLRSIARQISP